MKQFFVMALAAAAVVGCSKKEGAPAPTGPGEQLNIVTSIATSPSQSVTKSSIDGSTLPVGSVIGVHLADGTTTTNDFTPGNTSGNGNYLYYTSGRNVRFSNAAGANIWASVDEDENTKLLLFQNSETAKVYAYYPYVTEEEAATVLEGNGDATTLQIPLLLTGAIDASTYDGDAVKVATADDEKDYMYHKDVSETVVGAATTTTAKLVMNHALARVAFIVYTSQDAQQAIQGDGTSYYRLDGYTIKNKAQGADLKLNAPYAKMALKDGTITPGADGGQIDRTITNYKMQKNEVGDGVAAIGASSKVGNLVYPISITNDGSKSTAMEVVFHIARVATGDIANSPVGYAIPFTVNSGDNVTKWEAGKSYTYTVKFTGNSLSIETVTVTDWVEANGGDMEIE
ncbi:MAG TPA: fimbrillin family protein [Candidatus Rikenella faecigallinarum]|uniref:Fimbrillin family protein n=1 Tax=Candidatus Rikenella faecigallinarum TaxID=2838745 RepID=A0A9D1QCE4_9BACT|nr:fimbrillin family protein [Candidatus Rikenella faecigallinarum]